MSTFEKQVLEETAVIRKAKYKVKNAEGKYEVVYLETSAGQVEETAERVFVSPAEKGSCTQCLRLHVISSSHHFPHSRAHTGFPPEP